MNTAFHFELFPYIIENGRWGWNNIPWEIPIHYGKFSIPREGMSHPWQRRHSPRYIQQLFCKDSDQIEKAFFPMWHQSKTIENLPMWSIGIMDHGPSLPWDARGGCIKGRYWLPHVKFRAAGIDVIQIHKIESKKMEQSNLSAALLFGSERERENGKIKG